jgi:hypothetical protein
MWLIPVVPALTFEGKRSYFRVKPAYLVGHLPVKAAAEERQETLANYS